MDQVKRDTYLEFYQYDMDYPFDSQILGSREDRGCTFLDLKLESVHDQYVPAVYVRPQEGDTYPAIIFLHGRGGSKEDVNELVPLISQQGYAAMAIDCQYHGERNPRDKNIYSPYPYSNRETMIQTIIDCRRAVDFLESRTEIDESRIGLLGGSMGGILGTLLAAVEERIRASVLMLAGGNWKIIASKSEHRDARALRGVDVNMDTMADIMAPVDPLKFVDLISPRPVLFQLGRRDRIVPAETGEILFQAAGEPKEVDWYDSGHGLPLEKVVPRVISWLQTNLREA